MLGPLYPSTDTPAYIHASFAMGTWVHGCDVLPLVLTTIPQRPRFRLSIYPFYPSSQSKVATSSHGLSSLPVPQHHHQGTCRPHHLNQAHTIQTASQHSNQPAHQQASPNQQVNAEPPWLLRACVRACVRACCPPQVRHTHSRVQTRTAC
ncbi:hypothetical protein BKA80DRAFT_1741 [Phyllosticta citrichinensis]